MVDLSKIGIKPYVYPTNPNTTVERIPVSGETKPIPVEDSQSSGTGGGTGEEHTGVSASGLSGHDGSGGVGTAPLHGTETTGGIDSLVPTAQVPAAPAVAGIRLPGGLFLGSPTRTALPPEQVHPGASALDAQPRPSGTPGSIPRHGAATLESDSSVDDALAATVDASAAGTGLSIPIAAASVTLPAAANIPDGPVGFQQRLEVFDSLISQTAGITQLTLDAARNHVVAIMTELKTFPEYDGFVVARDIHNLLAFARASQSFTKSQFVIASEKREKRAAKASKTNTQFDFSILDSIDIKAPKALASAAFAGIDALGSINVDDIATQMQKAKKK